ncbi:MAG: hypothetical protein SP1CHLAM54_15870 [Chlamydiia bacterium]|nr:hypothetical protein [Chlamydiia bacterium]MCH9616476.1 hypothetical protein [Chlamydiia bacterium]MCH9629538.1 hypothetical protein [Chlamydiia bacterium]
MNLKEISIEELAGIISTQLTKHGIEGILVGGACVTIYSENHYQSYDLDYVTYHDMKIVAKALKEIGFVSKGKYFAHPDSVYYVEFVAPPVAIGEEPIRCFENYQTKKGVIKMLTPTDSVKDRLAGYYHWNDLQSLEQALTLAKKTKLRLDLSEIERWSQKESQAKKFKHFLDKLNPAIKK